VIVDPLGGYEDNHSLVGRTQKLMSWSTPDEQLQEEIDKTHEDSEVELERKNKVLQRKGT
jgi:hypothetical protein